MPVVNRAEWSTLTHTVTVFALLIWFCILSGKGKKNKNRKKRNAKHNSDDEAVEESDEGDFDDREVDYMTDSDRLVPVIYLCTIG